MICSYASYLILTFNLFKAWNFSKTIGLLLMEDWNCVRSWGCCWFRQFVVCGYASYSLKVIPTISSFLIKFPHNHWITIDLTQFQSTQNHLLLLIDKFKIWHISNLLTRKFTCLWTVLLSQNYCDNGYWWYAAIQAIQQ